MKPRTFITLALGLFVCATAGYLFLSEVRARSSQPRTGEDVEAVTPPARQNGSTPGSGRRSAGAENSPVAASGAAGRSNTRRTGGEVRNETRGAATLSREPASAPASNSPGSSGPENRQTAVPDGTASDSTQKVLAYYFHGTQRCPTCRKLEAYSAEAIERGFGDAVKQGRLEWLVVNTDEPANGHFVSDYGLYTKSLVIVKMQGGKQVEWKNLERIWDLVGDKDDFIKYVQAEVSAYVGAAR